MIFDIGNLEIPEFDNHVRQPRNEKCSMLDAKNIIAEILGGEKIAEEEIVDSFRGELIEMEGEYSVLLRYKREKDEKYYPAVIMCFESDHEGNIIIRHISGVKQNRISYRFGAGFNSFKYFVELIKQNFTHKGIKVFMPAVPTNLEGTSYGAQTPQLYEELARKLETLNDSIID